MMEELDFSRRREKAATRAAAVDEQEKLPRQQHDLDFLRSTRSCLENQRVQWRRSGLTVFRRYAGAAVPFVDELIDHHRTRTCC